MSLQGQILIVVFSLVILFFVFRLLRDKKINEAGTLWWTLIVALIVFLTVDQPFLFKLTHMMGAYIPISVLILFSLAFIMVMLIYFSVKVSVLSNQVKELSQALALLNSEDKETD